mgnify:CR=1 FL=1
MIFKITSTTPANVSSPRYQSYYTYPHPPPQMSDPVRQALTSSADGTKPKVGKGVKGWWLWFLIETFLILFRFLKLWIECPSCGVFSPKKTSGRIMRYLHRGSWSNRLPIFVFPFFFSYFCSIKTAIKSSSSWYFSITNKIPLFERVSCWRDGVLENCGSYITVTMRMFSNISLVLSEHWLEGCGGSTFGDGRGGTKSKPSLESLLARHPSVIGSAPGTSASAHSPGTPLSSSSSALNFLLLLFVLGHEWQIQEHQGSGMNDKYKNIKERVLFLAGKSDVRRLAINKTHKDQYNP